MEKKELLERILELEILTEQLEKQGSYLAFYYPVKGRGKTGELRSNIKFNHSKFKENFVEMVDKELDSLYQQLYNRIKGKYK